MIETTTFTTPEAARLAGVSPRQIDYWVRTDLLAPSVLAKGSGTQHRFSPHDVFVTAVVKVLMDHRVDRRAIKAAVDLLVDVHPFLWVIGRHVEVGSGWDVLDASTSTPALLVVNLGLLRDRLRDALRAI